MPRSQRTRGPKPNRRPASERLPASQPLAVESQASIPQAVLAKPTTHPNVFRKRIKQLSGNPRPGDWVAVYHTDNDTQSPELFAYGLYNPKSEIALRLVRWSQEVPDLPYWDSLIDRAISLRTDTLGLDDVANCYRVIHAEADGFPGLVIDRYADCLSAEVFSIAMGQRVEELLPRFSQRLGTQHWLVQPGPHLQSQEGFHGAIRKSPELPAQVRVQEYDVEFRVAFGEGHKTGFFCDQRDNRRRLAELCQGKSVLDLCCYTGGFAISAAKAGASQVTAVDLDAAPLETARQNANLNQVRAKFTQADAFAYMRDMLRLGRQFDVVVLDPPKLIRNRAEVELGTRKHFDLNRLAMQLVKPGGFMLTCTCAGLLPDHEFTRLVRAAARSAFQPSDFNPNPTPRAMQIIGRSGAAGCHPVSANCPETEYLKAMWLRL